MEEHPLTGTIGAEITGIDLRQSISDDLAGLLRHALARHQVLFFRGQHLSLDQLKAFTRAFGPLMQLPYVQPLDGEPEIIRVLKEADEQGGGLAATGTRISAFWSARRRARSSRRKSFRPLAATPSG